MLIENIDYKLLSGNGADPGNRRYILLRDFPFWYRTTRVVIPEGFEWDGPTGVPLVWGSYKMWERPALMHDYMYSQKGQIDNLNITQPEADEWFFYHLRVNGVPAIFTWVMRVFLKKLFRQAWDGINPISKAAIHQAVSPLTITGAILLLIGIISTIAPLGFFLL